MVARSARVGAMRAASPETVVSGTWPWHRQLLVGCDGFAVPWPTYQHMMRSRAAALASILSLMDSTLLDQARKLSPEDQLKLAEALWDGLAERAAVPLPTETQCAELDRRLAEDNATPEDVVPWSEVKAEALQRTRR